MKFNILNLLLLFALNTTYSQEREFGVLSPGDLSVKECYYEKDAPAVVLFDLGNSSFIESGGNLLLRFTRHVRIKIYNEAAFDKANVEIPLFESGDDFEQVIKIEGITYNTENSRIKMTELNKKNIFKEDINEHWSMKKFAMPQVKEGSIIEYKYIIYSPFYTHLKDWEFQTDIPTFYSQYTVDMIPFYSYRYRVQGTTKLDHFKNNIKNIHERFFAGVKFKDTSYEFGMKNQKSFKDESFISSRNDYIKKIDFQLSEINYPTGSTIKYMESWPALAEELLKNPNFGKYIKKAKKWGEENFAHLKSLTETERIDKILDYMKLNYKWDSYSGKYAHKTLKEFNKELTGNAGNINLSTIGALKSVGINASPVIISTRDNGKVDDSFPYSNLFNYVVIMVKTNDKLRLLDATDPLCTNRMIPPRCINGEGYIIEKDNESWVKINSKIHSAKKYNLNYKIDPDNNTINGICNIKCTGYNAVSERYHYHNNKKEFIKDIENKGLKITDKVTPVNLNEKELPFEYSFTFLQNIDHIDNQLIISPFTNYTEQENPFKQEDRDLPVDMIYLKGNVLSATIEIPEGYKAEIIPSPKQINSENVSLSYNAQIKDNKINVIATYFLRKQTYAASSYLEIKNFMNEVISKLNAKIILQKNDDLSLKVD